MTKAQLAFRPRQGLPVWPITKPSLSAVRDLNPSKMSPCSRCQHAEFIHAYTGPCLFHDCECPFFTPAAEPES
jgi:hypothetical protein